MERLSATVQVSLRQEQTQVRVPQGAIFFSFFFGIFFFNKRICRGYGRTNFDAYVCNNALCKLVQHYWVPHCKLQKLSEAYKSGQNREIMALRSRHRSPPLGPQPTRPLLPFPLYFFFFYLHFVSTFSLPFSPNFPLFSNFFLFFFFVFFFFFGFVALRLLLTPCSRGRQGRPRLCQSRLPTNSTFLTTRRSIRRRYHLQCSLLQ